MTLLWAMLAMIFLTGSAYCSGAEMGLYSLNRLRLRLRVGRTGDPKAARLLELSNQRDETIVAVLLMQNIMNYLLTVATVSLLMHAAGIGSARADIYAAIILSPITFVFGDVVPKNWFRTHANRLMYPTVRLMDASLALLRWSGILYLLRKANQLLTRLTGQPEGELWRGARAEIMGMLRDTAATGALSEEQTLMIERVMNLSSVRVGKIMVPREHVVRLPWDTDRRLFELIVRRHDFSRMPVLTEDRREVAGVVNIYDVLTDEAHRSVRQWMRPPVIIPAQHSAMQALLQLRQAREAMGIVTDPRRGFVGIVTLKDLVEEIFGELAAW